MFVQGVPVFRTTGRWICASVMLLVCLSPVSGAMVANAGEGEPYPGTVDTTCKARAENSPRAKQTAYSRVKVTTNGNGRASGKMTLSYFNKRTDKVRRIVSVRYGGQSWKKVGVSGLNRGNYSVSVAFDSRPADSVYKDCSTSFAQKVRRARKR